MSKLKYFLSLLGGLILSGCVLVPSKTHHTPDSNSLIAQDMVNVLVQVEQLPADTTTLDIPSLFSEKDPFTATLVGKFREAGYAVRTTPGSYPDAVTVSYELARHLDPQHGAISTYTVSVGAISVRRSYITVDSQQVEPLAPMQIKGTSATGLRLDSQVFGEQDTTSKPQNIAATEVGEVVSANPSKSLPPSQSNAEALPQSAAVGQSQVAAGAASQNVSTGQRQAAEPSLLDLVAPTTNSIAGQGSETNLLRGLSDTPTRNVRELGQSNFAEVFEKLAIVKEIILIFDNDSVRMGPVNKARTQNLISEFDQATDVFSVIGCSNGSTSLAIGQEGLALGRAERVREELLIAGVPGENILEEGCWAGDHYDELMPRRGVVLSLKRHTG